MHILGIPGSLRAGSSNHALLQSISQLDASLRLTIYDGVGRLPHFSPDLDTDDPPAEVARFRALVRDSAALVVSSPEYVHGLPGSLKNALDWLASSGEIMDKHVLVWSAGEYAYDQLLEVLRTLTNNVLLDASLRIGRARQAFDPAGRLTNEGLAAQLSASLTALRARVLIARSANASEPSDGSGPSTS